MGARLGVVDSHDSTEELSYSNSAKKSNFSISKGQRESLGLINIGTFLEYFDFKVYIHVTVILNVLFFPKTDPYTQSLLMALSFSMAYLLRPLGSLLFGFLGDIWGRKTNIIITTLMMSIASFVLGCMPTYDQVGWIAPLAVIICRAVQGISSGVEIIGAIVYTAELVKAPRNYFFSALIGVAAEFGTLFSLLLCTALLTLRPEDGWRYVFFIGSGIAVIGSIARTRLKESPEFLKAIQKAKKNGGAKSFIFRAFTEYKSNTLNYFLLELRGPFLFFLAYISLSELLARNYGYTPTQIIRHNLFISLASFSSYICFVFIARYIHPLRLLKRIGFVLLAISIVMPFVINDNSSIKVIFLMQALIASLNITGIADAIFTRGFPVIGRYTVMGVSYSLARAFAACGTSYGCVVIASKYGFLGVSVMMALIMTLHLIGVYRFVPCKEDRLIEESWRRERDSNPR